MSCLLTQIISSCAASVLSSSTVKKHDNLQQLNRKFEKKKQLELKDLEKKQRVERRAHRGSVIKLLIESQKLQCVQTSNTHLDQWAFFSNFHLVFNGPGQKLFVLTACLTLQEFFQRALIVQFSTLTSDKRIDQILLSAHSDH